MRAGKRIRFKGLFFELENGEVAAIFKPLPQHQSYRGHLHGGMAAVVLDEMIGRAVMIKNRGVWGVTVELTLRYKKRSPRRRGAGRWEDHEGFAPIVRGNGEIVLGNGDVAVTASGKYLKLPLGKIAATAEFPWQVWTSDGGPQEITI
jgi:hypothetical protein